VKTTILGNTGATLKCGNVYIWFTTITKDYMILGKEH